MFEVQTRNRRRPLLAHALRRCRAAFAPTKSLENGLSSFCRDKIYVGTGEHPAQRFVSLLLACESHGRESAGLPNLNEILADLKLKMAYLMTRNPRNTGFD